MEQACAFSTGKVVATPGAIEAMSRNKVNPVILMARHLGGDWGDLSEEDRQANDEALQTGARLLSAYKLEDQSRIWIITEAAGEHGERAATTYLLPEEY
jgi:hypothetical protein